MNLAREKHMDLETEAVRIGENCVFLGRVVVFSFVVVRCFGLLLRWATPQRPQDTAPSLL